MIAEKEVQKFKDQINKLEEENTKLRQEKDKIVQEKDKIVQEKDKIVQEKKKLEKEFEEFKIKHSKTVANLQKALKIKPNKKKKSKPIGAPIGHKGYTRNIPERIDIIKPLFLKKCPHCNTKLTGKTQEIRSRHVTDIKLISKTKTTRYDIHRKYCPKCKKIVEPEVPNVLPYARFGLNLMLLVMYLKLGLRLPGNKICSYFMDLHNLKISEGEIVHILKQLVIAFGDYYAYLEKMVKLARVKHSDTTSWRINGKNYHAWVFIGAGIVLYKIRKRNNHKVALALFGKKQSDKVLVVDRFSAFRTLAEKSGFLLQLCWSHILQDAKELHRDFGAEGKWVKKRLKDIYAKATALNHKGTDEMVDQLKAEIFLLTQRHYKHNTIRRFVNNLWRRDADNLFRFVTDPEIDSTNNLSERELRALVIIRKISNGSRSTRGAHATGMLLSIIQTVRFQKKNVLGTLQHILNNPSRY